MYVCLGEHLLAGCAWVWQWLQWVSSEAPLVQALAEIFDGMQVVFVFRELLELQDIISNSYFIELSLFFRPHGISWQNKEDLPCYG